MNSFDHITEEIKSIISTNFYGKVFDKDVADALEISRVNFATMKKRGKIPYAQLLDFCAKNTISINWLLYGQSPESLVEATNRFFRVKYFEDISASAGGGAIDGCEFVKDFIIPGKFIEFLGGEGAVKNIEVINVTGDSMEPTFSYGDLIFIDRAKVDFRKNDVFVLRTPDGLFIKRLQLQRNNVVALLSDNTIYPIQFYDMNEVEIIGKVLCRFGEV